MACDVRLSRPDFQFIDAGLDAVVGGRDGEANEPGLDRLETFHVDRGLDGGTKARLLPGSRPLQHDHVRGHGGSRFPATNQDRALPSELVSASIAEAAPEGLADMTAAAIGEALLVHGRDNLLVVPCRRITVKVEEIYGVLRVRLPTTSPRQPEAEAALPAGDIGDDVLSGDVGPPRVPTSAYVGRAGGIPGVLRVPPADPKDLGRYRRFATQIFGDPIDKDEWRKEIPIALLENMDPKSLAGLRIYFDAGTNDRYGFSPSNIALSKLMKKAKINHTFKSIKGGGHSWGTGSIQTAMKFSFPFVTKEFTQKPTSQPAKKVREKAGK